MTLMFLSLASIKLTREVSTTMALTNLCELVTLQMAAFSSPFKNAISVPNFHKRA
jgi:hypothetical protein